MVTRLQLLEPKEYARISRAGDRSCYGCKHLSRATESWEMPAVWWWECDRSDSRSQLKSFPYLNTKCPDHTPTEAES